MSQFGACGDPSLVNTRTARLEQKTAARTEDAVKIYGKGQMRMACFKT